MKAVKHVGVVVLFLYCAVAQDAERARIEDIVVSRQNGNLRVEISLSAAVKPAIAESHTGRLVLQLPGTIYRGKKSVMWQELQIVLLLVSE